MALQEFLQTIPPQVIERIQSIDLNIDSENCNKEINTLLQRTVLLGGKRLRPLLTYLMGNLFGRELDEVHLYAKSIEMVHAASLSHDDVIDNATTRRDLASINVVSSNKKAVLAGDYLLAEVIVNLTNNGNLQLVREMSRVIQELAEGEWIQLDLSENRQYTEEMIREVALKKTASVMSYCCVAPAIAANAGEQLIRYARQFGVNLGLAFQMMDDTLDFSGNSMKDNKLDVDNGIVNSVLFRWLELNPQKMQDYRAGKNLSELWSEDHLDEAIEYIKNRAHQLLDECADLLNVMASELSSNQVDAEAATRPLKTILNFIGDRNF